LTEEALGNLFGGKPITSFKSRGYIVSAILETSGNSEGRERDLLDHVRDAHPIPAPCVLDVAQPRNTLLPVQPEKAQVPAMQSEASTEGRSKVGAKADSASVLIFIWDHKVGLDRGCSGKHKYVSKEQIRKALLFVRNRLHAKWCTKVVMSFWKHVVEEKRRCKLSGATFDTWIYKAGLTSIEYTLESD
jgi:hypothetical protein